MASPTPEEFWLFGAITAASGANVSPRSAMRCTPVRAAVQAIAEPCGQLPLMVYRVGEDGGRERATDHPAFALLHNQANEWTPATTFREQLVRDALLWGNGFAWINRTGGEPRELIRLDPATMQVDEDDITGEPYYRRNDLPGAGAIDRRDIIHIRAPSLDGVTGESPVMQCRESIGLALAMEAHACRLFKNGARPSGVLKFPSKLTDATIGRIKASWQAMHSGEAAGGTALLEEGGDFTPLSFNSTDAQFVELWERSTYEISRAFRVPPILLNEYGRATWSNSAQMADQFLKFGLRRWLQAIEGEVRLKLFTPEERDQYRVEYLIDDLLRADTATRFEAYSKAIASRILSPNEIRAMENRGPYTGGDTFENPNTSAGEAAQAAPGGDDA